MAGAGSAAATATLGWPSHLTHKAVDTAQAGPLGPAVSGAHWSSAPKLQQQLNVSMITLGGTGNSVDSQQAGIEI